MMWGGVGGGGGRGVGSSLVTKCQGKTCNLDSFSSWGRLECMSVL